MMRTEDRERADARRRESMISEQVAKNLLVRRSWGSGGLEAYFTAPIEPRGECASSRPTRTLRSRSWRVLGVGAASEIDLPKARKPIN